jgi:hypothetical protein
LTAQRQQAHGIQESSASIVSRLGATRVLAAMSAGA